ncbi:MAG: 16S rRNA (cytosine(1402)-N(4))-methyltransferase [Candidatus Wildermuthbacteria bacterium RIFCSPHIGHO2_12_FULL_45_9]|uniref:Ribosomal RNA small subunit methyltransferase H n=1 Tax=Candidatus Wildermuthbacteria bacterium RIFCSPHIGHO2_02_FULL_45_25 TaxID=1802450 RepID=A0A1G2R214_9BACT|nr:MAG: 16S rRNA (cytosine(1402)-N(4))-methyltransferase [Candidatus Wildermuthbacteria bacterium RIFCSPHIGHO2_01_FULL_45_20]OHA66429.1 MAG: 16S rRNA (cytosine(1402)-N(4))-methyltransferase [Candidatus Wildermuthbacteria bacterium RIFCSPHIGHO2_02_FULL_45_25]OHA71433.1 MAG: 16S rRNA (cytosine(1402)-N(4))-methyltransferase [Candidatus Wildermuthbacteria bacterium RIFCSPHIGHO2_12_FULL_45_9]
MHISVLTQEVLEYLNLKPNDNAIDGTAGGGGHTQEILKKIAPKGKVLAIDWDPAALERVKERISKEDTNRVMLWNGNFADLKQIAQDAGLSPINAVLLDLGFSSDQLEQSGRGFSFLKEEPLDMRYNPDITVTAEEIVNIWNERDLEEMFEIYGEEQYAKRIAKQIVRERAKQRIQTTRQLLDVIERAIPRRSALHPATRTFQALRICVNNELEHIKKGLQGAVDIISPEGRIAVISFHSLEDRIVKQFFKEQKALQAMTKKPIIPQEAEIKSNPRSRSAKLRVAQKIET